MPGFAFEGEVAEDSAHDTRKLETVPREAAGEMYPVVFRVAIDDEVAVW